MRRGGPGSTWRGSGVRAMGAVQHKLEVRVRYVDTDQMGVVHHARYFEWFEMGRTELIRALGLPYRELEQDGYHLPVVEAHAVYRRAARYDDVLTVVSTVEEQRGARLKISYRVLRGHELLAEGYTVHVFLNDDGRPVRPPRRFAELVTGRKGASRD